MSKSYGKEIIYNDTKYFTFPEVNDLINVSIEEYRETGMGFRAKYIYDAVQKISSGEVDLKALYSTDTTKAKEILMSIKGIGEKVSDCILLFALHRIELFPIDVWVRRILETRYNMEEVTFEKGSAFANEKWGEYAGIAQQYLFYYERETSKEK